MTNRKASDVSTASRPIPSFFNPQSIGPSLREVDVSLIQTESEKVISRWFHGTQDADLFIWTDERNNVIKQQVSFCGQIVEWNVLDGVRTGMVIENEIEGPSMPSSETIQFDLTPQSSAIRLAFELVRHITQLDEPTRGELLHQLTDRPSLTTMKPEEVLRRFGSSRDDLWTRLKAVFRKLIQS